MRNKRAWSGPLLESVYVNSISSYEQATLPGYNTLGWSQSDLTWSCRAALQNPPPPHTHTHRSRQTLLPFKHVAQSKIRILATPGATCTMDNGSWKHTCGGFTIIISRYMIVQARTKKKYGNWMHRYANIHAQTQQCLDFKNTINMHTTLALAALPSHIGCTQLLSYSATQLLGNSVTQLLGYSVTQLLSQYSGMKQDAAPTSSVFWSAEKERNRRNNNFKKSQDGHQIPVSHDIITHFLHNSA